MGTWIRYLSTAIALMTSIFTVVACAAEPSSEADDPIISVTATLDSVACLQCYHWHWKGSSNTEHVADSLIATVSSPAQFAGTHLKMFVYDNNVDVAQSWQVGTHLSFST